MPKKIPPLSDVSCRTLRYDEAADKVRRIRDGEGLYLEALASGRKVWRLEYRTSKGTKTRATLTSDYGKPGGSLSDARLWRDELRAQISNGTDPNKKRKNQQAIENGSALFDSAADEWLKHKSAGWAATTEKKVTGIVRRVLRPSLGKLLLDEITPADIQDVLQPYDDDGRTETAHSGREYASAIFRRAMLRGVTDKDPAQPVQNHLRPNHNTNFAHFTDPKDIGRFMRAIDGYDGVPSVVYSLRILPRVFTRPSELRLARWEEFDLKSSLWTVPAERMKERRELRDHMVPLSRQVVGLLEELSDYSPPEPKQLLFPSVRTNDKPISDNTVRTALRIMGFPKEQIVPHGLRHTASTQLNELGWEAQVIERQLAHRDSNKIRGIYNKAEYWSTRVEMMQSWSDYLDELKERKQ